MAPALLKSPTISMQSPSTLEPRSLAATLRREHDFIVAAALRQTCKSVNVGALADGADTQLREEARALIGRVIDRVERGPVSKARRRTPRGDSASSPASERASTPERYVEAIAPDFWAHVRVAIFDVLAQRRVSPTSDEAALVHRTIDEALAQRAVERSRERLREEMELVDRCIAILGHDLRNPLNAVASGAEVLLRRGDLTQVQQRIVSRMVSSSHRMAGIIDQLFDWTRARRGGVPLSCAPVELARLVTEVVGEIEAVHPARSIVIRCSGRTDGSWDAERVAQALSNLVGNAVGHSPPSEEVTIEVTGTAREVDIAIHNAGPPIPPDVLPTIFAPFRRADGARVVGLGLGLYIVREIATAHGGRVDVRSSVEEGTTFRLTLPR